MADINDLTIVGRLTKDAEMKPGNLSIGFFTIASNRKKKEGNTYTEEASFFDVNVFGAYAEAMVPHLLKGVQVVISGSLKQERWKENGTNYNKSRVIITADSIQIIGGRHE